MQFKAEDETNSRSAQARLDIGRHTHAMRVLCVGG